MFKWKRGIQAKKFSLKVEIQILFYTESHLLRSEKFFIEEVAPQIGAVSQRDQQGSLRTYFLNARCIALNNAHKCPFLMQECGPQPACISPGSPLDLQILGPHLGLRIRLGRRIHGFRTLLSPALQVILMCLLKFEKN